MRNDKTTLNDLSVFTAEDSSSIFGLLNYTTSQAGKNMLRKHIENPPADYTQLCQLQDAVKYLSIHTQWPEIVTNGTIVMLEKYFDAADTQTAPPGGMTVLLGKYFQKLLNKSDYFFTQFSISHLSDFLKGCKELTGLLNDNQLPVALRTVLEKIDTELQQRLVDDIISVTNETPYRDLAMLNYKARRELKNPVQRLLMDYAKLDAWHAMAIATNAHKWVFPELVESAAPVFEIKGLYHPLLSRPVAYHVQFSNNRNFMVLTGANMSGKTTFMRAIGVAALLAHIGMGVPAQAMRTVFLHGIITNMHVEDDIMKGESYFFAEVQRMKMTATQLLQSSTHLVLMDELFKGTNVHDAYECTRAVIEGLLNHNHHLMVLSTHLYEVAQHYSNNTGIHFAYFVTRMDDGDQFRFTYELKQGISNDRIGYRILQNEGVLKLLNKSKENH